jgi:hypothetical protein
LELIVRNIARYPQSATSTSIRYQPAMRYLAPTLCRGWRFLRGRARADDRCGWPPALPIGSSSRARTARANQRTYARPGRA